MLHQSLQTKARLFLGSFAVSAIIGLSYIAILEIAQYILGYNDGLSHSIVAFCFYLLGVFVNYAMQKKLVFRASNSPLVSFFVYNITSALLVSGLSGLLYSSALLQQWFTPFAEGASTAIALLIISPITFIVLKTIFKNTD